MEVGNVGELAALFQTYHHSDFTLEALESLTNDSKDYLQAAINIYPNKRIEM